MPTARFFIGIDAGGTRTRLRGIQRPDLRAIDHEGPGANPQRVGFEEAVRVLTSLLNDALMTYPGSDFAGLCLGLAGIGRDTDRGRIVEGLRQSLGLRFPSRFSLMSDADLAIAAAYGATESGLLLIAGTGSIVLGRTRGGKRVRAGGWGYLLGDEGGGYRIGLAGLQALARAFDGGPDTSLTVALGASLGIDTPEQLIHAVYSPGWSAAAVAPLVLAAADAGDAVCDSIVNEQTEILARQTSHLVATTPDLDLVLRFTGGLTQHPGYAATLRSALKAHMPNMDIAPLATPPVEAALALAQY
jgi:N-acetylglucosamine kinase-like BadF-type ATPase